MLVMLKFIENVRYANDDIYCNYIAYDLLYTSILKVERCKIKYVDRMKNQ